MDFIVFLPTFGLFDYAKLPIYMQLPCNKDNIVVVTSASKVPHRGGDFIVYPNNPQGNTPWQLRNTLTPKRAGLVWPFFNRIMV